MPGIPHQARVGAATLRRTMRSSPSLTPSRSRPGRGERSAACPICSSRFARSVSAPSGLPRPPTRSGELEGRPPRWLRGARWFDDA
jgi:hypothetical protein